MSKLRHNVNECDHTFMLRGVKRSFQFKQLGWGFRRQLHKEARLLVFSLQGYSARRLVTPDFVHKKKCFRQSYYTISNGVIRVTSINTSGFQTPERKTDLALFATTSTQKPRA